MRSYHNKNIYVYTMYVYITHTVYDTFFSIMKGPD